MRPGAVHVESVESEEDARAFAEFPYRLYRGDPTWVAPLRSSELERWSPERNASLRGRWSARFLARRDGRVMGRIAAAIDPLFAERWKPDSGFFGFYECEPDIEVSRALFEAAENALRARGVKHVFGPVNLSTHEEVGLLIHGFTEPPTLLTSYNPPYYRSHIEAAQYVTSTDYHAYRCDPVGKRAPVVDRLLRSAERAGGEQATITVRAINPRRWDDDIQTIFELYNQSFADLWGFVPISHDEFQQKAKEFKPFYKPELALIAERERVPVGFAIALPDINVALKGLDGRLWPFGLPRILYRARRIRTLRLMLLGVVPENLGHGIAGRLAFAMVLASQRLGMKDTELSLVQSNNRRIRKVIDAFGGVPSKTYRLYEKALEG